MAYRTTKGAYSRPMPRKLVVRLRERVRRLRAGEQGIPANRHDRAQAFGDVYLSHSCDVNENEFQTTCRKSE
eukprot:758473-Hanusia_phi.AAC.1